MTVEPQQDPGEQRSATGSFFNTMLIALGILGVILGCAMVLLATLGQQIAARAHPTVDVTGVVVANGFHASCQTLSGNTVEQSECPAAAVKITGSTNTDAVPIDSTITVTAPNDLTVGADYHGSQPTSALPRGLNLMLVPAVVVGVFAVGAIVIGARRAQREHRTR